MWVPSGKKGRATANIAALETLLTLRSAQRPATADEQAVLAQWSSWGAVPEIFEEHRPDWQELNQRLRELLTDEDWGAARTTTLNAHYTDPDVATAMWGFLAQVNNGTDPMGTVLEPGCGAGTFMLKAPDSVSMVGVELDPVSAEIAAHLNPGAHIRNEGFERTRLPLGEPSFAAAIGNVPFGGFALNDPTDNPLGLSIHNHFLAKSLKHTAPGGYAVLLTSSFTMDAKGSTARAHLSEYGDLMGAVRLPTGAMSRVAGTEAVTDILILRRREDGTAPADTSWVQDRHVIGRDVDGNQVTVNGYWAQHPGNVLGEHSLGTGMHGQATVTVDGPVGEPMYSALRRQLTTVAIAADTQGKGFSPSTVNSGVDTGPGLFRPNPAVTHLMPGHVRSTAAGFTAWDGRGWALVTVPRNRVKETAALLRVRDGLGTVISTQNDPSTTPDMRAGAREGLARAYDSYVATYGPISRFEWSNPRPASKAKVDRAVASATAEWRRSLPEDLSPTERAEATPSDELIAEWASEVDTPARTKLRRHLDPVRDDPAFGGLLALERFDEDSGNAVKTRIFSGDVIAPPTLRETAHSPRDAVAISLDETRSINPDRVAELLGVPVDDVPGLIEPFTYTHHSTGELVPEWIYLSGDVRTTHQVVAALIEEEGRGDLTRNLQALQAHLPEWVSLDEVTVRPGVPWIPAKDLHSFAEEVLGVTMGVRFEPHHSQWVLDESVAKGLFDPMVQMKFGTEKKSVRELWLAGLNNKSVTVTHVVDGPNGDVRRTDPQATRAARERIQALNEAFATWVSTQPARVGALEATYNQQFNSYRAPDYTSAGAALTLEGLSEAIQPHPYQRSAVARALNEPTVLLDHVVGAGKTGSMVMSAMELRRTGVANKPWVVVPNHLVEQTAAEWATWYPAANVLTIPTGADKTARTHYVAASASGDWDAVIVPQTVFESIGVSPSRTRAWAAEEMAGHRAAAEAKGTNTKAVESQVKRIEKTYEKFLSKKDPGLPFESTGCDYLIVDEAHHYKNLARVSDYPELACSPGSNRALDLDFKLRALRESKLEAAGRAGLDTATYRPAVAMFATGTPVANQLSELWVMQRYLQPELLEDLGLNTVDSWARTFTTSTSKMEIGPDGSTWRLKDRVNRLVNAPELISLVGRFTDRIDKSGVNARLPELHGEQRVLVTGAPDPTVAEFVKELAYRANNLPDDPSEDNLLKITHEGRMIALDPRTLGLPALDDGGRVQQVADSIMSIHRDTQHTVYHDATGAVSDTTGGLQLVFCDKSVPQADGSFSVYEALATELTHQGMDGEKIAFIHDANDDAARADLFAKCRTGAISVLIGSTDKMGTGVNVQNRAVGLHHMDCPWRPADLEQREGRIIRQGNQNEHVHIRQYVTEGTYDAVMWQIVANKAAFIAQTKHHTGHRALSAPDDEMTVSAAAASAIATGDPRIIERAELIEQIKSLDSLRNAHYSQVRSAHSQALTAAGRMGTLREQIATYDTWLDQATPTAPYTNTAGHRAESVKDIGDTAITTITGHVPAMKNGTTPQIGTSQNLPLYAALGRNLKNEWQFSLHLGSPTSSVATYPAGVPSEWSPQGLGTRINNLHQSLTSHQERLQTELGTLRERLPAWEAASKEEFTRADELTTAHARLDEIDAELALADDANITEAADTSNLIDGTTLEGIAQDVHTNGQMYERNSPSPDYNTALRTGDVIIGVEAAKTVLYSVEIRSTDPGTGAPTQTAHIQPVDDPNAEFTPLHRSEDRLRLVSRRQAALTQPEAWALEHNARFQRLSPYTNGADFAAIAHVDGSLTLGRVTSTNHRAKKWGEPLVVTMRVTDDPDPNQSFGDLPSREITLADGDRLLEIKTTRGAREYDPGADIQPGATLITPVQTPNGPTLPAGATVTESSYETTVFNPDTGDTVTFRNNNLLTGTTRPAPDLPPAAFEQWGIATATAGDLRRGDILDSRDLDPKARISQPVRVLNTPYGDKRIDIDYAPVAGGDRASIFRASHHEVTIQSRSLGSLRPLERIMTTHPGSTIMEAGDLTPGDTVVDAGWRDITTGTFTELRTMPGSGQVAHLDLGGGRAGRLHLHTKVLRIPAQDALVDPHTWPSEAALTAGPQPPPPLESVAPPTVSPHTGPPPPAHTYIPQPITV